MDEFLPYYAIIAILFEHNNDFAFILNLTINSNDNNKKKTHHLKNKRQKSIQILLQRTMSKELATSIVLAARKMELNEKKEVISIIYHMPNGTYCINAPEFKSLYSFEILYNYLIQQGYVLLARITSSF